MLETAFNWVGDHLVLSIAVGAGALGLGGFVVHKLVLKWRSSSVKVAGTTLDTNPVTTGDGNDVAVTKPVLTSTAGNAFASPNILGSGNIVNITMVWPDAGPQAHGAAPKKDEWVQLTPPEVLLLLAAHANDGAFMYANIDNDNGLMARDGQVPTGQNGRTVAEFRAGIQRLRAHGLLQHEAGDVYRLTKLGWDKMAGVLDQVRANGTTPADMLARGWDATA